MKILLLGATGRTGKLILEQALEDGYHINCLSRDSGRIKAQPRLNIFEGEPVNSSDLERAIEGCDAVINVLNISRKSDFPWAGLRTPKTYLSDVMQLLAPIAKEKKCARLVVCSAWGVLETKDDIPNWFKWLIDNSNIGHTYKDHERQEEIIANSNLDWTIVRPVGLTNSKREEILKETFGKTPKPSLTISRKSLAKYLVDSLEKDERINTKVVISRL